MTGLEAWAVIAPILAAHSVYDQVGLNAIDKAYVIAYAALNEYDEKVKKNDE